MKKKKYILSQVKTFDATGGYSPDELRLNRRLVVEKHSATRPGEFVIDSVAPHTSSSRWLWSTIEYGTPIEERFGVIHVKKNGKWIKIKEIGSWRNFGDRDIIDAIKEQNMNLTGISGIPKTWIFNDFGHMSIKYFVDRNHNYKKDGKEEILSDFIHTTPDDEINDSLGESRDKLSKSHGCVHIYPKDMDVMIATNYLKTGNIFEVHAYSESVQLTLKRERYKYLSHEVHFFPKDNKLVVYALIEVATVEKIKSQIQIIKDFF